MSDTSRVKLRWCVTGGLLRDVTEFAEIPARNRPPAICPVCGQPVVMKLGSKRAYHCAHQPSDNCVLMHGETALHFNTKMHFYRQLLSGNSLSITVRCAGIQSGEDCGETLSRLWLEGWDAVEVEYALDSRRPDIVLLKAGRAIGAVEIFVTHQVDTEKAIDLRRQGIQWIEVKASPALYEQGWNTEQPLAVYKVEPELSWRCDSCLFITLQTEKAAGRQRAAEQWQIDQSSAEQQRRQFLSRHNAKIRRTKTVDCYYRDERVETERFYEISWVDGDQRMVKLEVDNPKTTVLDTAPSSKDSRSQLMSVHDNYLRLKSEQTLSIVTIADWAPFEIAKAIESRIRRQGSLNWPKV
jgi:hypothetical protein